MNTESENANAPCSWVTDQLRDDVEQSPTFPLAPPPAPGAAASRPYRDPGLGSLELTSGSELVVTDTTYGDVDVAALFPSRVHDRGPHPVVAAQ